MAKSKRSAGALMAFVCMPISLLVASVIWWADPQEVVSFWQVVLNNAVPLYVFNLPLAVLVSLAIAARVSPETLATKKEAVLTIIWGGLLEALAAGLTGLLILGNLRVILWLWPHFLWGFVTGGFCAAILIAREAFVAKGPVDFVSAQARHGS